MAFIDANNMAVSWNTYASLPDSEATVHYGLDPLNLDQVAYSNQTTFETSRTFSHHAVLSGLQPKTLYHYRVAHTNCYAVSATFNDTDDRQGGRDPMVVWTNKGIWMVADATVQHPVSGPRSTRAVDDDH